MRPSESTWAMWPAVTLYALAIGYCAGIHSWWMRLESQTQASWVQAVGSVLAILATAWVARRQIQHERELEAEREKRADLRRLVAVAVVVDSVSSLCKSLVRKLDSVPSQVRQQFFQQISPHEMERLIKVLEGFHYFELPRAVLIESINNLLYHMRRATEVTRSSKNEVALGVFDDVHAIGIIRLLFDKVRDRSELILEYCNQEIRLSRDKLGE